MGQQGELRSKNVFKGEPQGCCQWLTSVILATQEADTRRIAA
jgi:hypothetical protein